MLWNLMDVRGGAGLARRICSKAVEGCIQRRQRDKENTGEFQFLYVNAIGCSCWNKEKRSSKANDRNWKENNKGRG